MKLMRKNSEAALTLIEVLVVVVVLIILSAFFLGLVVSPLHSYSALAPGIACVNNLKQVGLGFRLWAQDNNDKYPMQVSVMNGGTLELGIDGNPFSIFIVMTNELMTPKILSCPADTGRDQATNFIYFSRRNISYFVNADAAADSPRAFLCGDRNIIGSGRLAQPGILELTTNTLCDWDKKRHTKGWECRLARVVLVEYGFGNIAVADGSVTGLDKSALNQALQNCGVATNRLLIP